MAGISDAAELLMLDWLTVTGTPTRPAGFYLALYTTNPNFETGAGGTEATGGSYVRKSMTMDTASAGATANSAAISWTVGTDIAAGTYTGCGIYTADTAGTFLGGADFADDRVLTATGDKINFAIGAVDLTLD